MFEVRIRITCVGWKCRQKTGELTVFEGYLPAEIMGNDNIVMLKKVVPEGWTDRYYPDSSQPNLHCPVCSEDA